MKKKMESLLEKEMKSLITKANKDTKKSKPPNSEELEFANLASTSDLENPPEAQQDGDKDNER